MAGWRACSLAGWRAGCLAGCDMPARRFDEPARRESTSRHVRRAGGLARACSLAGWRAGFDVPTHEPARRREKTGARVCRWASGQICGVKRHHACDFPPSPFLLPPCSSSVTDHFRRRHHSINGPGFCPPSEWGDNDFNYEFHTLLIQTFAHGLQLATRLIKHQGANPSPCYSSRTCTLYFPRLVKFTQFLLPQKVVDCTGTGPGSL